MIRRPPRSTQSRSSAASDVYKRQPLLLLYIFDGTLFHESSAYITCLFCLLSSFTNNYYTAITFKPKIWDYNDTNKTSRRKINQPHLNRTKTQKDHGAGFAIPERAGQH